MANIRRDDNVMVISGKDRGKSGKVNRVIREKNRVVVAGLNIATKHVKSRPGLQQAGIIHVEAPLHLSNVMLICTSCNEPTRIGHSFLEDGTKVRVCKKCEGVIDEPGRQTK